MALIFDKTIRHIYHIRNSIEIQTNQKMKTVKQRIKKLAIQFFVNQNHPDCIIFWSMFIYCKLQMQVSDYDAQVFFILGLLYAIVFRCNHFYLYSPVLNAGIGVLAFLNLLLGIFAANQKWKFYLFIFIVGQSILKNYQQALPYYEMCSSLFISVNIYTTLLFLNKKDNIVFFTGFGSTFLVSILGIALNHCGYQQQFSYYVLPLAAYSCYVLIKNKIQAIASSNIENFKQPQIMYQYLKLFQQKLNKNPGAKTQVLYNHRIGCDNPQCQCKSIEQNQKTKSYTIISSLYEQILRRLNKQDQSYIFQKYIKYKIENGQVGKAIILSATNKFGVSNIFRVIDRIKNSFQIQKQILRLERFGQNTTGLEKLVQYDTYYVQLVSQIKKNIQTKIRYWIEAGKDQPVLNRLQAHGLKLIDDLQTLHYFFQQKVQPIQKKFKFYAGSILYAIYLQGTSNYKEYSENLIKQVLRTIQSIKFSDQKVFQTYALQIKLEATYKDRMFEVSNQGSFQQLNLKIVNVSSICAQFLKIRRYQLIGSSLNRIIPEIYQEKHNQGIANMFKFNNQQKFNGFKFLGKSNYVPIKLGNGQISRLKIRVIISATSSNQLSLICIMQRTSAQVHISLIDFKAKNLLDNPLQEIAKRIIKNEKTKTQLDRLVQDWNENSKIEKYSYFYQEESRFQVTIDSPFYRCFKYQPPVHLQYFCTTQNQQNDKQKAQLLDYYVQKLTQNMQIVEGQSTSASLTFKNNNLVKLLTEFQGTNSIFFFKKYIIYFSIIMISGGILMSIIYNTVSLKWEKQNTKFNPYKDVQSISEIQRLFIFMLSRTQDMHEFTHQRNTVQDMKLSFTANQIATKSVADYAREVYPKAQKLIYEDIIYTSQMLKPNFDYYLSQELYIYNHARAEGDHLTQKMRIRNILTNYLVDIALLIRQKNLQHTIFTHSYLFQVHPILLRLQQQNRNIIQQSFRTTFLINIILGGTSILAILLSLIFLYRFKILYQQKIQDFFNLVVSIKGEQIEAEINMDLNMLACISKSHKVNQSVQIKTMRHINLMQQRVDESDRASLPEQVKFLSYETHLALRKREGQLQNLHQTDRTNLILFVFVLISAVLMVCIQYTKLTGIQITELQINQSLEKIDRLTSISYLLASTKDYLYNGDRQIDMESGVMLSDWIRDQIETNIENSNNDNHTLSSHIVQGQVSQVAIRMQSRSQQLSKGLFYSYISKAYIATKTNSPSKSQFRKVLIYAQTVCQEKQKINYQKYSNSQTEVENSLKTNQLIFKSIYAFELVWCTVGLVVGVFLIRKLNSLYVKQITMISFLNSRMIGSNKRIQSFLEKISKGLQ